MKYAVITRYFPDDKVTVKITKVPKHTKNSAHDLGFCEETTFIFSTIQQAQDYAAEQMKDDTEAEMLSWDEVTNNL